MHYAAEKRRHRVASTPEKHKIAPARWFGLGAVPKVTVSQVELDKSEVGLKPGLHTPVAEELHAFSGVSVSHKLLQRKREMRRRSAVAMISRCVKRFLAKR